MSNPSRSTFVLGLLVLALIFCGSAAAATFRAGPPLNEDTWTSSKCESATGCAFQNDNLPLEGGSYVGWPSAQGGLIVRLNVVGVTTSGLFRVRTSPAENVFLAASPPLPVLPAAGVQSYPMSMPVSRGDQIVLSMSQGGSIGILKGSGLPFSRWDSDPPETGLSPYYSKEPGTVGFNVEIQLPPEISALGSSSGPTTGGTAVSVIGYNFEGASAVLFGGVPATSFTVESEKQITVIAPPRATPGAVGISVTTAAGTANSGVFTYSYPPPTPQCVVPSLRGKSMKSVRRLLGNAECELRGVKRLDGATAKTGRVSKQSVAPGTTLRFGAEITVTLEPPHAKASGKKK